MLRQKEEILSDPMVSSMNRHSMRYLTKWTFVSYIILISLVYNSIVYSESALELKQLCPGEFKKVHLKYSGAPTISCSRVSCYFMIF